MNKPRNFNKGIYSKKNTVGLICALLIVSILLCSVFLGADGPGYLFRFKKVGIKYYANGERVHIRNIDYQSVVSDIVTFPSNSGNNINLESNPDAGANNIQISYPDYPTNIFTYRNFGKAPFDLPILILTGKFSDSLTEELKISLRFDTPIKMHSFSKLLEFWVYTTHSDAMINFHFTGNNANGAHIVNFTQEVDLKNLAEWYLESFNFVVYTDNSVIENLELNKIEFIFPSKIKRKQNFAIAISDLRCLNVIKNERLRHISAKHNFIEFEDKSEQDKWKIRLGDTPLNIDETGIYREHTQLIPNGKEYFLEFNQDRLSTYEYLLIDFAEDYAVPIDNLLNIIVRGRGMGEEISFILEDSRHIYYELSAGYIDFDKWKSIEVNIPTAPYMAFVDREHPYPYVKLLGLKVNPGYDGNIGIAVDNISSIIDSDK